MNILKRLVIVLYGINVFFALPSILFFACDMTDKASTPEIAFAVISLIFVISPFVAAIIYWIFTGKSV